MTEENKYVEVTFRNYFDNGIGFEAMKKFQFQSWVEEDKKRRVYWESPEGKAELKRQEEEREARWEREAKFRKRWQKVHDWLVKNGCECDHDGCY